MHDRDDKNKDMKNLTDPEYQDLKIYKVEKSCHTRNVYGSTGWVSLRRLKSY